MNEGPKSMRYDFIENTKISLKLRAFCFQEKLHSTIRIAHTNCLFIHLHISEKKKNHSLDDLDVYRQKPGLIIPTSSYKRFIILISLVLPVLLMFRIAINKSFLRRNFFSANAYSCIGVELWRYDNALTMNAVVLRPPYMNDQYIHVCTHCFYQNEYIVSDVNISRIRACPDQPLSFQGRNFKI